MKRIEANHRYSPCGHRLLGREHDRATGVLVGDRFAWSGTSPPPSHPVWATGDRASILWHSGRFHSDVGVRVRVGAGSSRRHRGLPLVPSSQSGSVDGISLLLTCQRERHDIRIL